MDDKTVSVDAPGTGAKQPTLHANIEPLLARAATRLRFERACIFALYAAIAVHGVLLPWLLLKSVWPITWSTWLLAVLGALAVGALVGLLAPVSLQRAARELDRRLSLQERLQSVLEFGADSQRATVRALLHEVARVVATLDLRAAVPLPPTQLARPARYAAIAALAAALLLWLPGIRFEGRLPAVPSGPAVAAAQATTLDDGNSTSDPPETPQAPPPPRLAWDEVEFKDATVGTRSNEFMAYEEPGEEQFAMLDTATPIPRLAPDGKRDSTKAAGTHASEPLDFVPRRATLEEAAERLGELEKLWGTPAPPADKAPPEGSENRETPEALEPASEAGEEVPDHPVTEDETVDVNDLHPDEERMQEQSDRFSSLPEGMDAATQDMPPWPKAGPGEGQEDDSDRDAAGTGRSSGKPGSGFAEIGRGRATARIAQRNDEEMRLRGLRQAGREESYETDLPALSTQAQAQLAFGAERSRFTRRAEQALSEDWVPFESREQVKRYFRAIEARR